MVALLTSLCDLVSNTVGGIVKLGVIVITALLIIFGTKYVNRRLDEVKERVVYARRKARQVAEFLLVRRANSEVHTDREIWPLLATCSPTRRPRIRPSRCCRFDVKVFWYDRDPVPYFRPREDKVYSLETIQLRRGMRFWNFVRWDVALLGRCLNLF